MEEDQDGCQETQSLSSEIHANWLDSWDYARQANHACEIGETNG